jgi:hypothetical protein
MIKLHLCACAGDKVFLVPFLQKKKDILASKREASRVTVKLEPKRFQPVKPPGGYLHAP